MEGAVENTIKAYDVQLKRGEAALGRPGVLVDPNALDREKLKVKADAEKLLKRMDREEAACWDRFWTVWLDQDDR